jgi:preprotein translocase subunit YajC
MKSLKPSSIFTSNNSIVLIIFVFSFIAIGMFFLIQKTTEKQKQDNSSKNIIEEKESQHVKNEGGVGMINSIENAINNDNDDNADSYSTEYNTVTGTFQDEVGLFIKKEEPRPEIYSHSQTYIPPFNNGKETRCGARQVNRPIENNNVQSCVNSDLVKVSSDASY